MADMVKFLRGLQSALPTTGIAGSFYLTTDTHRLYTAQADGKIVPVNEGVVTVENVAALATVTANAGDFFYATEENILCVYNGQDFIQINRQSTLAELGGVAKADYDAKVGELEGTIALKADSEVVYTKAEVDAIIEGIGAVEGSGLTPFAVGDTPSSIVFDTTKAADEMAAFFGSLTDWTNMDGIEASMFAVAGGDIPLLFCGKFGTAYALLTYPGSDLVCVYATEPFADDNIGLSVTESGWQNLTDGVYDLGDFLVTEDLPISDLFQESLWNGVIAGQKAGGQLSNYYTKGQVDGLIQGVYNNVEQTLTELSTGISSTSGRVDNLEGAIALKADSEAVYTKAEVDAIVNNIGTDEGIHLAPLVVGETVGSLSFDTTKTTDEMVAFFGSLTDWTDMGGIPACMLATAGGDVPLLFCAKFDDVYALISAANSTVCLYATGPFDRSSDLGMAPVTESGWQNLVDGVYDFSETPWPVSELFQEALWNGIIAGKSGALSNYYTKEQVRGLVQSVGSGVEQNAADISILAGKVDELEVAGGQANVIETIKVNGTALDVADKAVDITVPTGALASKDEVTEEDLAEALATKINNKLDASDVTGDLLTRNASEFATSTQGELASSAVQPGDLEDVVVRRGVSDAIARKQDIIPANTYDAYGSAEGIKTELTQAINGKVAQGAYDTKVGELVAADERLAGLISDNADEIATIKGEGDGSIKKALADAKKYTDDQIGAIPAQTDYSVTMTPSDVEGLAKRYTFTQCGETIGTIDLAKELVVTSGSVKEVTEAGQPYADAKVGDKYIELVIANQEAPIYVPAKDLVDIYTAKADATQVQVAISNTNEISATLVNGGVQKAHLASDVQTSLGKADTALQSHQDISHLATKTEVETVAGDLAAFKTGHTYTDAQVDAAIDADVKVVADALDGHKGDTVAHITADERTAWNGAKQGAIDAAKEYTDNQITGLGIGDYVKKADAVGYDDILTKTEAATAYAVADHNHDEDYAGIDHKHDDVYAGIDHKHDDAYAAKSLETTVSDHIAAYNTKIGELAGEDTAIKGRIDALEGIDHDAYKAADTALETSLKGYADAAEADAKSYADGLLTWIDF